jgi:hypothetical protein
MSREFIEGGLEQDLNYFFESFVNCRLVPIFIIFKKLINDFSAILEMKANNLGMEKLKTINAWSVHRKIAFVTIHGLCY